jgi:hypothetical protein
MKRELEDEEVLSLAININNTVKAKDVNGNFIHEDVLTNPVFNILQTPEAIVDALKTKPIAFLNLLQTHSSMSQFWKKHPDVWKILLDQIIRLEIGNKRKIIYDLWPWFIIKHHETVSKNKSMGTVRNSQLHSKFSLDIPNPDNFEYDRKWMDDYYTLKRKIKSHSMPITYLAKHISPEYFLPLNADKYKLTRTRDHEDLSGFDRSFIVKYDRLTYLYLTLYFAIEHVNKFIRRRRVTLPMLSTYAFTIMLSTDFDLFKYDTFFLVLVKSHDVNRNKIDEKILQMELGRYGIEFDGFRKRRIQIDVKDLLESYESDIEKVTFIFDDNNTTFEVVDTSENWISGIRYDIGMYNIYKSIPILCNEILEYLKQNLDKIEPFEVHEIDQNDINEARIQLFGKNGGIYDTPEKQRALLLYELNCLALMKSNSENSKIGMDKLKKRYGAHIWNKTQCASCLSEGVNHVDPLINISFCDNKNQCRSMYYEKHNISLENLFGH